MAAPLSLETHSSSSSSSAFSLVLAIVKPGFDFPLRGFCRGGGGGGGGRLR